MRAYALAQVKGAAAGSTPFRVAELILDHGADAATIAAAMLAEHLWDGRVKLEEIRKDIGTEVAAILDGTRFPSRGRIDNEPARQARIRALLGALAKTPRKAFLLIAFRFIELDEARQTHSADLRSLAQETMDLFVPIANRLSLSGLRRRLEDLCFQIMEPSEYEALKRRVAPKQAEDDRCLKILTKGVRNLLAKNGLQAEIHTRIKSLCGLRRKMIRTGQRLEEIMDRVGMRIIVASVPECYSVLGLLHTHFKPIPGTFDDYIGLPKANGYQSLHTCVYPVREISHKPIEFQVRTQLMHIEAEHGSAAHWLYKTPAVSRRNDSQKRWIKGLLHQHRRAVNTEAFIEALHRQVYAEHLVVFGKGGRIVRLPDKATVLDYLDKFNIRLGPSTVVRVNGKIAVTDRCLQDGDSIEVLKTAGSSPTRGRPGIQGRLEPRGT